MTHIHYVKGDIFESKAQVVVNTVNCKGVMGKGLALAFKQKYPDMFVAYEQDCKAGRLRIGRPRLYQESTPWILNFPTKDHWRFPSKLEYLEKGLAFLVDHYKQAGIKSIAFPKLGAQNGKLSWDEVGPLMARYLSQLEIDVYIYIGDGDKEYQYDPLTDRKIKERIWKEFNKLALSEERLHLDVGLNLRDAKKVVEQRKAVEFKSQADFDAIKLAKTSSKKIKEYLNLQQVKAVELIDFLDSTVPSQQTAGKRTQSSKRKKRDTKTDVSAKPLFPADTKEQLVG